MTEDDKLTIIEAHLTSVVLPLGIGLKPDGVAELAKRILHGPHYVFSQEAATYGQFIGAFCTAEAVEQSLTPSASHLFRQSKTDDAPVPQIAPPRKPQVCGMDKDVFEKLPASRRLELFNAEEHKLRTEAAAKEKAALGAAVKACLPEGWDTWTDNMKWEFASTVEAKAKEAMKKANS